MLVRPLLTFFGSTNEQETIIVSFHELTDIIFIFWFKSLDTKNCFVKLSISLTKKKKKKKRRAKITGLLSKAISFQSFPPVTSMIHFIIGLSFYKSERHFKNRGFLR